MTTTTPHPPYLQCVLHAISRLHQAGNAAPRVPDVAAALGANPASLSRVIATAVSLGLVERLREFGYIFARGVRLTAEGVAIADHNPDDYAAAWRATSTARRSEAGRKSWDTRLSVGGPRTPEQQGQQQWEELQQDRRRERQRQQQDARERRAAEQAARQEERQRQLAAARLAAIQKIPPDGLCRHCGQSPKSRPRGLCLSCYYTPGVKEQHHSTSKFAHRGVGLGMGGRQLGTPTDALPGTEAKVLVMAERARRKQQLFHPNDVSLIPTAENARRVA